MTVDRSKISPARTRINGRGETIWVGTKEAYAARQRALRRRLKIEVMSHYCDEMLECACCKEQEVDFLTINHLNGGGNKHRKQEGGGVNFVRYLKRENYPSGYSVLCFNCNFSTWYNGGTCVHAKKG